MKRLFIILCRFRALPLPAHGLRAAPAQATRPVQAAQIAVITCSRFKMHAGPSATRVLHVQVKPGAALPASAVLRRSDATFELDTITAHAAAARKTFAC